MKIIIVGGGPAGLTCAINAKNDYNEVIVLEKNKDIGKKLLVTGAGHCNLFNQDFSADKYNSNNKDILEDIINENNKNLVMPFLKSIGIICKNKGNYIYPMAYTSVSVLNALKMACERCNIQIKTNEEVLDVKSIDNKYIIRTNNSSYEADKLIVSCGSKAYPSLGATDTAIKLANNFNIKCSQFLPSLTGLKTDNKVTKKWDKLRCDVKLKHFEDDTFIKEEVGEVQLTNYGISGICTFNLSGRIIRNINKHKETIKIDFLPDIVDLKDLIKERINTFKDNNPIELLEGLLNYKILYALFDNTNLINKKNIDLNDNDINLICKLLKEYSLNITGYNDFDNAQVCSGGILLSEINPNTFECNNTNNLFFIGEALDVDGICGGYNLGFAWISGILCGKYINN